MLNFQERSKSSGPLILFEHLEPVTGTQSNGYAGQGSKAASLNRFSVGLELLQPQMVSLIVAIS